MEQNNQTISEQELNQQYEQYFQQQMVDTSQQPYIGQQQIGRAHV